jgi:hypothetical protein
MGRAITELQHSAIALTRSSNSLLKSLTTLQGSSVTDLQVSMVNLMHSVNTLIGSANSLAKLSQTDLTESTNSLLGSQISQMYMPQRHYYTTFGTTSEMSELHFGFTSTNTRIDLSSGSLSKVVYSYGGSTGDTHGECYAGEAITDDRRKSSTISVKCLSNADPVARIWAWG